MQRSSAENDGDPEALAAQLQLLSHMQRYAGLARCRHQTLSEYFGQDYEVAPDGGCGACDVCLDELETVPDGHVTAQKILSAVYRTGQRYGRAYVIDVLRGSRNEKVLQRGHDGIPTFGICADVPAQLLGNYVDQLVDRGVLVRSDGEYPILLLGSSARDVLRGDEEVELRVPKAALQARPRRSRRRPAGGAPREDLDLTPAERELFEELRALRRRIASELGVPPYVVFSGATLVVRTHQITSPPGWFQGPDLRPLETLAAARDRGATPFRTVDPHSRRSLDPYTWPPGWRGDGVAAFGPNGRTSRC